MSERTQPPPDAPVVFTPRQGFHVEWVTIPTERLEVDPRHTKCRRPGCKRKPVWSLFRRSYSRSRGYGHWWSYCDWHTYGRDIREDGVYHRRLVPDSERVAR